MKKNDVKTCLISFMYFAIAIVTGLALFYGIGALNIEGNTLQNILLLIWSAYSILIIPIIYHVGKSKVITKHKLNSVLFRGNYLLYWVLLTIGSIAYTSLCDKGIQGWFLSIVAAVATVVIFILEVITTLKNDKHK